MGFVEKAKHKVEEAAGAAKEVAGEIAGNEQLEVEGRAGKAQADVKQAGDRVGDGITDDDTTGAADGPEDRSDRG
jgi:uncharacterized protein YjbJ (UPF0337 family)